MKKLRWFVLLVFVGFTAFIFLNSARDAGASSGQSLPYVLFIKRIVSCFSQDVSEYTITLFVRKAAHITEFFIQASLLGIYFVLRTKNNMAIYVLFVGLLTACTDEYIQLFFVGRSCEVRDVFIDFIGVIISAVIYTAVLWRLKRKEISIWNG